MDLNKINIAVPILTFSHSLIPTILQVIIILSIHHSCNSFCQN
jgi:hypothetical protein